jgi:hypothetical protein
MSVPFGGGSLKKNAERYMGKHGKCDIWEKMG